MIVCVYVCDSDIVCHVLQELEAIRDPVERQGTEAWLKLARKRGRFRIMKYKVINLI